LLYLDNNQLTGQIDVLDNGPSLQTFQRLTNLTNIDLSHNNFRGYWELDALLSSLPNLDILILSYSGISVTTSNARRYVNLGLEVLSLASCSFKVFSVSNRAMTYLAQLDLSSNEIHGHIPEWIGKIGRNQLSILNLANNSLTSSIPNVYKDWSELEGFILNANQLEGKVPISLNKYQCLKVTDLGNYQLSETFPSWLGDLPNLQVLVLKSNNFRGASVTSSKVEFLFQRLQVLDLSHNGFVGQLPTNYFQNFNAMKNVVGVNSKPKYVDIGVDYTIVDLSDNKFLGEIPNITGYLKSLKRAAFHKEDSSTHLMNIHLVGIQNSVGIHCPKSVVSTYRNHNLKVMEMGRMRMIHMESRGDGIWVKNFGCSWSTGPS
ncbi:hypothetical protein M8C21_029106, partial [Ambrosia artemisiifolia]